MTQYLDKDALVAKIEDLKLKINWCLDEFAGAQEIAYDNVLDAIYCKLEPKEVDFETAFTASIDHFDEKNNYGQWLESDLRQFAKHFFELGLKASNVLTWEDMKQIHDIMVECSAIGLWSKPDEEYYQEVVKRFKAQKGE